MSRMVVLGGAGLFGRTLVERLNDLGIPALVASRRGGDIQVDADDPVSIRAGLVGGDLVIDAAGPFYKRSMALLEAAIEIGFDLVDINDDLGYAEQVLARAQRIAAAGIRVLSSASSVSAIAAAMVRRSNLKTPVRVTGFLAPASRHTANRGSALSLIRSLDRPIRALRDGHLQALRGWSQERCFAMLDPVGPIRGRLFESADAVYLPRIWPSLREVDMYVDSNTPGLNTLLTLSARFAPLRRLLESQIQWGAWLSRRIGTTAGGIGYEIACASGRIARAALVSSKDSFLTAVAPAILATRAIAEGQFQRKGLVLPDQHVDPSDLVEYLESSGVEAVEW